MIYDIDFPSYEHTQYLGPLKEISTKSNLGLYCQVQDYLEFSLFFFFLKLSLFYINYYHWCIIVLGALSLPFVFL